MAASAVGLSRFHSPGTPCWTLAGALRDLYLQISENRDPSVWL